MACEKCGYVHDHALGEMCPADCHSCDEGMPPNKECPRSKRECGHHCNHSWSHDYCHWCEKELGEEDAPVQES